MVPRRNFFLSPSISRFLLKSQYTYTHTLYICFMLVLIILIKFIYRCCVCLGEFEIKEELLQVPSCKHVFHVECIHYWLHSNTTCPLCRCSIVPITKLYNPATASVVTRLLQDSGTNSNQNQQNTPSEQQEQQQLDGICTEQLTIHIEGSSSASSTCSSSSKRLSEMSSTGNDGSSDQGSVIAHLHIPNT